METPDNMDPLYELSGCLDHGPNTCRDCGCEIYHSNESANPFLCETCFRLECIEDDPLDDFIQNVMRPIYDGDFESMLIKKIKS